MRRWMVKARLHRTSEEHVSNHKTKRTATAYAKEWAEGGAEVVSVERWERTYSRRLMWPAKKDRASK